MTRRLLVVSESADETLARAFAEELAALPGVAIDQFAPTFSFAAVPAWLVRESRQRVDASNVVVCLLGTTSMASAWTTWAVSAGLEAEKRVVCVRLHSASRDIPPPIVVERRVPVVDADARAVGAFIERGDVAPLRAEPPLAPPGTTPLANRLAQRQ